MLFTSTVFIFVFLPIVVSVYYALLRTGKRDSSIWFLSLASILFYAHYNPNHAPLLLASIIFNFVLARALYRNRSRKLLAIGIMMNLSTIGFFKYSIFFVDSLQMVTGMQLSAPNLLLPLAISFFTFQQIAYLCDTAQGNAPHYSFSKYLFFVVFFPQLIAGPILHHFEILPQTKSQRWSTKKIYMDLSVGLSLFLLGLCKKLLIADNLDGIVHSVLGVASPMNIPNAFDIWYATFAYSLQIYFDFSAYSDMAIGLARMFGFRLPLNFNSPYKASSIIDFWRRWHMTLSRFLRDYLYIPLGGGRSGSFRKYSNILIVMAIGGLWHGAAWSFVLWGLLHGIFIVTNYAWRTIKPSRWDNRATRFLGWALTFTCVCIAWVPFRVNDIETAALLYLEMFGVNGLNLGYARYFHWGNIENLILNFGLDTRHSAIIFTDGLAVIAGAVVAFLCPNAYEWMARVKPALNVDVKIAVPRILRWRPNVYVALAFGLLATYALVRQPITVEFLYFQF